MRTVLLFGTFGTWEILLLFVVVLLVFGARRLPELGAGLGRGIRNFQEALRSKERDSGEGESPGGEIPPPESTSQGRLPGSEPEKPGPRSR